MPHSQKSKIAILIPTRGRGEDFRFFAESWKKTTEGLSDVIVRIDDDDTEALTLVRDFPEFTFHIGERKPFLDLLNDLAKRYCEEYPYLGFMEDDCNFNTPGWETTFIQKLEELGDNGIVWGNDLLNEHTLVGLPFLNSKIVQRLGYMAPPEIKYLWADHFWLKLGRELNSLYYFPHIVVEHRHYSTGKRKKDDIAEVVDEDGTKDFVFFNQDYMVNNFQRDVNLLK